MEFGENHLNYIDYALIAGTLLLSLAIGIYYAFSKQTTSDLLTGSRNLSPLPVAISMFVTYLSAISVLGLPSEIYFHGLQIMMMNIISSITFPLGAFLIVPVFYNLKLTSVNEYLELRYDSILIRWIAAFLFLIQASMLSGVVLYAPAIPLQYMMGIPIWVSIIAIAVCGTIYTAVGGIKAVIWTDVIQLIGILIGMLAIVIKGIISVGGFSKVFQVAADNGRLAVFDFTFDPFMRHNTLNFIIGVGLISTFTGSTHQFQVQRYSSLPTLKKAQQSIVFSVPIGLIALALIFLTGLTIFAAYADCDPLRSGQIKLQDAILPYFVTQQLSEIPGMLGLFISCIFSAVLSTLSSTLNSLAAVTWEDFLRKISFFETMKDSNKANTAKLLAVIYGVIIVGCAFLASQLGSVLPLTITGTGATSGPMLAVFIMGLFMPWVNKYGSISGILVGIVSMFVFVGKAFQIGNQHIPLPTSTEECAEGLTILPPQLHNQTEVVWPDKIFTISYLWYSSMGTLIAMVVGMIVSIITGGCSKSHRRNINPAYLHPVVRKCSSKKPRVTSEVPLKLRSDAGRVDCIRPESNPSPASYPYDYHQVSSTSSAINNLDLNIPTVQETLL